MADVHCFVCHFEIPATESSSRGSRTTSAADVKPDPHQLTTAHTQRCVYALLEQFLGYSLQEERTEASRWCTGCLAIVNDYDLAVQTAGRRESELVELFMNSAQVETGGGSVELELVGDDTQSIATTACEVEHLDEDEDELIEYSVVYESEDVKSLVTTTDSPIEEETAHGTPTALDHERVAGGSSDDGDDAKNDVHEDDDDEMHTIDEVYLSDVELDLDNGDSGETIEYEIIDGNVDGMKPPPIGKAVDPTETTGAAALFKCTRCVRSFESNSAYKVHITACKTTRKSFTCMVCGHEGRTRSELQIHVARHNGVNPFECDVCGRQFPFRGALVRHMTVHTREKPYQCDKCGKQFIHYSSFHMHQLAHDDIRDKQCTVCGLELRSNSHLTRHMRVHSGEKPYACPTCGQKFAQRYNMMTHFKTHQGIHRANSIRANNSRPNNSRPNIMRANTIRPYPCPLCQTVFDKASLLKQHRAEVHCDEATRAPAAELKAETVIGC